MRTRVTAVLSWLAATLAATLLVAAGVGSIRDTTRADELVARPPATTADTVPTSSLPADPGTTNGLPPTSTTAATTPPRPAAPSPPPTTLPPTTAPPTTAPATTTSLPTTPPPAEPITLTIPSQGGSATIRFAPEAVTVLAAAPAPGYAADISSQGATSVRVEFDSEERRSRIDASWSGGPVTDVRED